MSEERDLTAEILEHLDEDLLQVLQTDSSEDSGVADICLERSSLR